MKLLGDFRPFVRLLGLMTSPDFKRLSLLLKILEELELNSTLNENKLNL